MPELEFTVDDKTGEATLKIKGIKGKSCKPIHDAVSRDLSTVLGITESHSEDTPEMREVETVKQTTRLTLRS